MNIIFPPATIGIIGGGQLGKMLSQAAKRFGYRVIILDPMPLCPGSGLCDEHIVAEFDDPEAIAVLTKKADILTFEFENVASTPLRQAADRVAVFPHPSTLHTLSHRVREKRAMQEIGIKVADFIFLNTDKQLTEAVAAIGLPAVLKTVQGGYDGKGQQVLRSVDDLTALSFSGAHIMEAYVPFAKEISVICVRSATGEIRSFPVAENIHRNNILHQSIIPARISESTARQATEYAERVVTGLNGVGAFGIEMFLCADGEIMINEVAPRVHNSGHYTIEACHTSQFEQHIRAICNLPLGETGLRRTAVMINIIGDKDNRSARLEGITAALRIPEVNLHLYGKEELRCGRKMGHITALADSLPIAVERAETAHRCLRWKDD
ncbi:5-(carboxyamino)imidazole ribonucleotide synthase [Candidatus Bipolaricaulota bacterium]|nr:5-(carboxyamino)imidazole ribonucleotide synthase [Candidatus Bipolaricaulota bacterium]